MSTEQALISVGAFVISLLIGVAAFFIKRSVDSSSQAYKDLENNLDKKHEENQNANKEIKDTLEEIGSELLTHKITLFGVNGANGLTSRVRQLETKISTQNG
jgi:hypothetical protein